MSVYIKGFEMPKSCNECRFFVDAWCYALEVDDWRNAYNKPQEGKRLDGCPLIPVPDHGRLIDADALFKKARYRMGIKPGGIDEVEAFIRAADLLDAPTIIPAEEGQ